MGIQESLILLMLFCFTSLASYIIGYYIGHSNGYWKGIDNANAPPKPKWKKDI